MSPARQITVVQLLDTLAVGGKERVAVNLANGLAALGCKSHVIASRNTGPLAEAISPEVSLWHADRKGRFDLAGVLRIARYFDDNAVDVVHSHNQSSSYLARFAVKLCRSRPAHVVHDHKGAGLNSRKQAFLDRFLLNRVDAYISVSQELRDRAARLLDIRAGRCIFVRNGIRIPPEAPAYVGRPTVVHVANLHPPKDHATAMRAAAALRRRIPDLRWRCIGRISPEPHQYVDEVRGLIAGLHLEGCVELLGERSDVEGLLREANVGVLTSQSEGLPLSVLEYMACRLPVVVTETGQAPAIVRASGGGAVAPTGDAEAIAEALHETLKDPSRANLMGRKGRTYVAEGFSVETMVQEVLRLYDDILADLPVRSLDGRQAGKAGR